MNNKLSIDDYNAYIRACKDFIAETKSRVVLLAEQEKIAKMTYSEWYKWMLDKKKF